MCSDVGGRAVHVEMPQDVAVEEVAVALGVAVLAEQAARDGDDTRVIAEPSQLRALVDERRDDRARLFAVPRIAGLVVLVVRAEHLGRFASEHLLESLADAFDVAAKSPGSFRKPNVLK